jgi:hypothetical protein
VLLQFHARDSAFQVLKGTACLLAQARARDMEAFVVVLLGYSDDPREVSEIRASEARARDLADSLASKLEGPDFQAKLEALKQREVRCPFLCP